VGPVASLPATPTTPCQDEPVTDLLGAPAEPSDGDTGDDTDHTDPAADVGSDDHDGPGRPAAERTGADTARTPRWIRRLATGVFGLQLVILLGLSADIYHRFTLGIDFGIFTQAWSQIGTGNLNPTSTIDNIPYLSSHFELIMWPLAVLYPFTRSPFVLLVVQDVAIVGTNVTVFAWVVSLLRRSSVPVRWTAVLAPVTLLLLAINPLVYATAGADFHFEPLATWFVVLAAVDLWSGRVRRAWVWAGLCLLCGDVGGLYVLGLGLTGVVAARGHRRQALGLLGAGAAWILLISALGDNVGSDVSTGYAYLAGRAVLPAGARGALLLAGGVLGHPQRLWHLLSTRWRAMFAYLKPGGVVGFFTPWGFGVPLVVLLSAGLQQNQLFLNQAFQNFVVYPFVTFGTVWLVVVVRRSPRRVATGAAVVLTALAVLSAGRIAVQQLPTVLDNNASSGIVHADQAAALRATLAATPPGAEVVASVPIIGRFAQRRYVYTAVDPAPGGARPIPVRAGTVVVVLDTRNAPQLLPGPQVTAVADYLEHHLGATVLVDRSGVLALVWHPMPDTRVLQLP